MSEKIQIGLGELYAIIDSKPVELHAWGIRGVPLDARGRIVHVIDPNAGGEVRGYFLLGDGLLRLRASGSVGYGPPWPECDQAMATALGLPFYRAE